MAQMVYDIAIVGLGPAGSNLARTISKSFAVVAIDKKNAGCDNPGFRKPCGGLLAPDAQKALAVAGLSLPHSVLAGPQAFSVKTVDLRRKVSRSYQRFYINVDRHKFDSWLMSLIPEHVDVLHSSFCTDIVKEGGLYRLLYDKGGTKQSLLARTIVGADGSSSIVRRLFFKAGIRRYLAIQERFEQTCTNEGFSCYFDEMLTDCYAWSEKKGKEILVGASLPLNFAPDRFNKLKEKMRAHGLGLGKSLGLEACLVSWPKSVFETASSENGAFLAGEAGGFISPSSLEGISYAIETGILLGKAFNESPESPGKAYNKKLLRIRAKLATKRLKAAAIYTPWIRGLILRSGVFSLK